MAGNSGSATGAVENFEDQDCGSDIKELLNYIQSVGVDSEADIWKLDEDHPADALGYENAIKLPEYSTDTQPARVEEPLYSAANSSLDPALPASMAVSSSRGDGREIIFEILQTVMVFLTAEGDKNREMLMGMQQMQDKTLHVATKQMSDMTVMVKCMLDTMSQQMTQQFKMHQETVKVMTEQMKPAMMHGETLQAVQPTTGFMHRFFRSAAIF